MAQYPLPATYTRALWALRGHNPRHREQRGTDWACQLQTGSVAMVVYVVLLCASVLVSSAQMPENFTVAFIGDQGSDANARAVLELIQAQGADMVLHQGDFDYNNNPTAWDDLITQVLGANFPYFASIGNHDEDAWSGPDGYQAKLQARLSRLPVTDVQCSGDLGVQSTCTYKGLFFILSGVGTLGSGHEAYMAQQLAATDAIWRICSWHKNQRLMQVGGKTDEVGWEAYETCREGGAIIATAHEHSYARTHLLAHMQTQLVASTSNTLQLEKGKTFVFHSGLGGKSIRDQELSGPWWASVYTSTQGANYGALFCTFYVDGNPNKARCYFMSIDNPPAVPDQFEVISAVTGGGGPPLNQPPVVNASPDQAIPPGTPALLDGTVTDDGLPTPPGAVTTAWSQVSGPGPVAFANASAVDTTASFPLSGTYVLRLTANDGQLTASDDVTLVVTEPGGYLVTEAQVATGSDDAEEKANGDVSLTSSDLELVFDGSNQTVGLRFTGVEIPQRAVIMHAYVQFQVDETSSDTASLTIQGQAAENPGTFVAVNGNISTRPRTEAVVEWAPGPWTVVGAAGPEQWTPNLAPVLQEIVNRPGWASGQALVLIITGSGKRVAEAYNGLPAGAPLLHVEYMP